MGAHHSESWGGDHSWDDAGSDGGNLLGNCIRSYKFQRCNAGPKRDNNMLQCGSLAETWTPAVAIMFGEIERA